ncbi:MAG: PTS sugar transporter subunit IIC, partial [Firmicutes bacterium]|nr:PTS sugar transporter subunit IIC [Bacillota bacterium]
TSMLQIPNVFKKPIILLPAVTSSIVTGPLAVLVFGLHSSPVGSGMGTAGLVGVIETVRISWGQVGSGTSVWQIVLGIAFVCFILPAVISFFAAWFMRKRGWIKDGDMKLDLK